MIGTPRILLLAVLALLGLSLTACGNQQHPATVAENEGIYVDVDELTYQVQISRQLNPADIEDRAYLEGIPLSQRQLPPDQAWFAVFIRVENESKEPQPTTHRYEIIDTQEQTYHPITLPPENVFSYQPPKELDAESIYPDDDSASGAGPIQGSLLLFKVKLESLANRPVEFKIDSPLPPPLTKSAVVKLDI